jgi:hypothetical protein
MLLVTHVKRRQLGKVFIAPVDVILDQESTVQPDLVSSASPNPGMAFGIWMDRSTNARKRLRQLREEWP